MGFNFYERGFYMKKRVIFVTCLSLGLSTVSYADQTPATAFAEQAGTIAGTAKACGADISLLDTRSYEVIAALSNTDMERGMSIALYQKSSNNANAAEIAGRKIACDQVVKDMKALPLLQDDYKTSVIEKMKGATTPNPATPSVTTPNATTPASNGIGIPSVKTPEPVIPAAPAATPPTTTVPTPATPSVNNPQPSTAPANVAPATAKSPLTANSPTIQQQLPTNHQIFVSATPTS